MDPIPILQPEEGILIKRLFTRVMNQGFEPSECKQVLAFWLYLWRDYINCSFPEVILHISETLMKEVIDEARTCIQHLRARACIQYFRLGFDIPKQLVVGYMHEYETRLVEELCGGLQPPVKAALLNQQVAQFAGGVPRIWTGPRQSTHFRGSMADASRSLPHTAQPAEARSLFLTFSRGFSVSRQEIEEYINGRYGPQVVEAIVMSNDPLEPPMYAVLVLRSAADVTQVIGGMVDSASFSINAKPVWMRRHAASYNCTKLMDNIYK